MAPTRRAIGFMTGTSLDGLDAALVTTRGTGLDLRVDAIDLASEPFGRELDALRRFAAGEPLTAAEIATIAADLGHRHAELIRTQWPLTRVVACPIVCDLRHADLVAGGRGAPITPRADAILYRSQRADADTTVIVNLGGFVNVTLLPGTDPESAIGFDCCPCNHLLDAASRAVLDAPFDSDGVVTAAGAVDPAARDSLRTMISALGRDGRSGGDGDEHRDAAIRIARDAADAGRTADGFATIASAIAEATAELVARRCDLHGLPAPGRWILAGGGGRNLGLVARLSDAVTTGWPGCPLTAEPVDGVPPEGREAAAMAILGLLALDGVPVTTIPSTGRDSEIPADGLWIRSPISANLPGQFGLHSI
jgi:anhydro-N-acetylmuramic acid kinase